MKRSSMWVYFKQGYPELRNIRGLHGTNSTYRRWCIPNVFNALCRRLFPHSQFLEHLYCALWSRKNDKIHVFNGVVLSRTDWVSTFETSLPRSPLMLKKWQLRMSLWMMAKRNCRAIIAISERALELQKKALNTWLEDGIINEVTHSDLTQKMMLLPPPQPVLAGPQKRSENQSLRIILVGNMFFLKGGREAFRACQRAVEDHGVSLNFSIISSLESDSWFSETGVEHEEEWKLILQKSPWVTLTSGVSNEEVLQEIRNSHVALFPTKRDSYGYFTLEAQACGVPVISSDFGAQGEINSDECGWVVPTSRIPDSEDDALVSALLEKILASLDEDERFQKGLRANERIAQKHDYTAFHLLK